MVFPDVTPESNRCFFVAAVFENTFCALVAASEKLATINHPNFFSQQWNYGKPVPVLSFAVQPMSSG